MIVIFRANTCRIARSLCFLQTALLLAFSGARKESQAGSHSVYSHTRAISTFF
ncbi:hypothetical protein CLOM621_06739 [Clostridium sp. M62/1]|nr:hypothetical protein CLOM621_06739 [Clostridium sp. M62/1]